MTRQATAHHEAGHALAEHALGYRLRYVAIADNGEDATVYPWWPWRRNDHALIVAWAGPVAEARYRRVPVLDVVNSMDCTRDLELINKLTVSAASYRMRWSELLAQTNAVNWAKTILTKHDIAHAALADALTEHNYLPGRTVHRILRNPKGKRL